MNDVSDMLVRTTMNVSMSLELERFVKRLVESGRYHSAGEAFREGLRLLEQSERRRGQFRARFQEGLDSLGSARLTRPQRGR